LSAIDYCDDVFEIVTREEISATPSQESVELRRKKQGWRNELHHLAETRLLKFTFECVVTHAQITEPGATFLFA
jgi:hypothetical protein